MTLTIPRWPPLSLVLVVALVFLECPGRRAAAQTPPPPGQPTPTAPPSTDVYLSTLDPSTLAVGPPSNISAHAGYDNQPFFMPDGGSLLYTSNRGTAQTDIYRYDVAARATTRITDTAESEYSPTLTPDGQGVSVVRVEPDATQRLWRFPLRGGPPVVLLSDIKPVGYHAWIDDHRLALFILGDPPTLQIADTRTGRAAMVRSGIGRSMARVPGRATVAFVQEFTTEPAGAWLMELNPDATTATRLAPVLKGSEHFAWAHDGRVLMATGARIFAWKTGQVEWAEVADLSGAGITNITRLAVSPKGNALALVADDRAPR